MLFQVIRLSIMFVCFVKYELLLWIHIAKVKLYLGLLIFYFLRYLLLFFQFNVSVRASLRAPRLWVFVLFWVFIFRYSILFLCHFQFLDVDNREKIIRKKTRENVFNQSCSSYKQRFQYLQTLFRKMYSMIYLIKLENKI